MSQYSTPRAAYTILELTLVLGLLGLLMSIAAPQLSRSRDAAAVRGAAGDLSAAFSLARQVALSRRVPTAVVIDTSIGTLIVRTNGQRIFWRELGRSYGIVLRSNRDSAVYDARGLGYGLTNLTLTIRRGSIVDTLTMSRLGRLR